MGTFKEDLRKELLREAAFTEEIKARIVQGSTKRKRKVRWKMSAVSVAFVAVLMAFVFLNIEGEPFTPFTVNALPENVVDIVELLQENETVLPYVEAANEKQQVVYPDISHMGGYLQSFSHHPMIVEETSTYEIGDYVAYKQGENQVIAQVVGRPGDEVVFKNFQILVNGRLLALPKMIGAIDVPEAERQPIENYYFDYYYQGIEEGYGEEIVYTAGKNELVVSLTNYSIQKLTLEETIGKVVAIQKIEPSFLLNETEQVIYDRFKENYDVEVLRNVDPVTIAKMYVVSDLEQDVETNYALLTDEGTSMAWSREEHDEAFLRENIHDLSVDELNMIAAFQFNGIEHGQFVEHSEGYGVVNFTPIYRPDMPMGFQLIKNPDGIWQVAFMPLQ